VQDAVVTELEAVAYAILVILLVLLAFLMLALRWIDRGIRRRP
jgi:hypothetical protein